MKPLHSYNRYGNACDSNHHLLLISFIGPIVILLAFPSSHFACTQQERGALLSFLAGLSLPSSGSLIASWNESECCRWDGVSCDAAGAVSRVWLPSRGLKGNISPALANLMGLTHLNLSNNYLTGPLPPALLSSASIVVIDVSTNRLSGDLPEPPPSARGSLSLQILNISSNLLGPRLPSRLWNLMTGLVALNASTNDFTGEVPSLCTSSSLLKIVDISYNQFNGNVLRGLANCSELQVLCAGYNNITGSLPEDVFDITSLQHLSLPGNHLGGVLDGERIAKLSNLVVLDLGFNALRGQLPESIGQLKKLEQLLLNNNTLSGELPGALGNCTSLKNLILRRNNFSGELTTVDFSRLSNLEILDVLYNTLTGGIPASVYSCTSLHALRLANNNFRGQVAPEMSNLKSLTFLSLSMNSLTNISGMFWSLRSCNNLTALLLANNFYGEAMPDPGGVRGLENIRILVLGRCKLTGRIPHWLLNLTKLEILDMSGNHLTGSIPSWLGSLPDLFYLDLSDNYLSGTIPLSIMELRVVVMEEAIKQLDPLYLPLPFTTKPTSVRRCGYRQLLGVPPSLYLTNNNLTGSIPPEIGHLEMLQVLDISNNSLSGGLPSELGDLTSLEILDLSHNNFSGSIPSGLNRLHFLASFNVSYNDLDGSIPSGGQFNTFPASSFKANPKLCGSVIKRPCTGHSKQRPPSSKHLDKKFLLVLTLGVLFGGAFVLVLLGYSILTIKSMKLRNKSSGGHGRMDAEACTFSSNPTLETLSKDQNETVFVIVSPIDSEAADLKFADVLTATNNFDPANIIGCGGYGLVFKAELPNGIKLAIKKLNGDMCLMEREFKAEVEALSAARHENLVPLQGYCIRGRLRLLIYRYMENGTLDDWLHERANAGTVLDWPTRLKIARGASRGVLYIHQDCQPQIVHRDIKSSNILLDKEFKAHVADFGLARLILPERSHVTTELVGTLGYIPPEYGQAWVATLRGDIYSFGIVILELVTGRRPIEVLQNMSRELVKWVQEMRSQGRLVEVLDPLLINKGHDDQMLHVLNLACSCINSNPFKRPTIQEVASSLENVDGKLAESSGAVS